MWEAEAKRRHSCRMSTLFWKTDAVVRSGLPLGDTGCGRVGETLYASSLIRETICLCVRAVNGGMPEVLDALADQDANSFAHS